MKGQKRSHIQKGVCSLLKIHNREFLIHRVHILYRYPKLSECMNKLMCSATEENRALQLTHLAKLLSTILSDPLIAFKLWDTCRVSSCHFIWTFRLHYLISVSILVLIIFFYWLFFNSWSLNIELADQQSLAHYFFLQELFKTDLNWINISWFRIETLESKVLSCSCHCDP